MQGTLPSRGDIPIMGSCFANVLGTKVGFHAPTPKGFAARSEIRGRGIKCIIIITRIGCRLPGELYSKPGKWGE